MEKEVQQTFADKRIAICLECDLLWKNIQFLEQCSNCFCFVRAKTKIKSQSCPIGKW
jgi:hypothetical protein